METSPRHRRSRGFTLIEIMAVVLIIGLLGGIVGAVVFSQVDKARVNTAHAQVKQLESVLEFYRMDNARYPSSEQGLQALVRKPSGDPQPRSYRPEGYLQGGVVPKDPWGEDYQYRSPGEHNPYSFDLWSLGADGKPGGDGNDADVGNWASDEPGKG
ncbi:MAG: type II secretion system major pseudopilin GspG [Deltaproteobacteria bacterium]|nr:type II secretion system major pseudopilin GspG [Deltaproteobacteria bacterium]